MARVQRYLLMVDAEERSVVGVHREDLFSSAGRCGGKTGPIAGTLIALDPTEPKVDRFITLGGDPYLICYNSKLPIVVYVPERVEVRYRIWTAGAETATMERG